MLFKEWKHIFTTKKILIPMIAVLLIPVLYAGMFLWAFWDPYEGLTDLPVAVVNLDEGADYNGEKIQVGEDLVEKLKESKDFDYHFVSKKEAYEGLGTEKYYMVIELPQDFSENVTTVTNDEPEQLSLKFVPNEGYNFLAGQIGQTGVKEIKSSIAANISEKYAEVLFESIEELGDGLATASEASVELSEGAGKVNAGGEKLINGLSELSEGTDRFATGTNDLSSGASKLYQGTSELSNGLREINEKYSELSNGINGIQTGSTDLKNGLNELSGGTDSLVKGLQEIAKNTQTLSSGAEAISTNAQSLASGMSQLDKSLQPMLEQLPPEQKAALQQSLSQLVNGTSMLAEKNNELAQGIRKLETGQQSALAGAEKVNVGATKLDDGSAKLAEGTNRLAAGSAKMQEALKQASEGSVALVDGSKQVSDGTNTLAEKTKELTTGVSALYSGANELNNGTNKLYDGSKEFADKLKSSAEEASISVNENNYKMVGEPITLQQDSYHEVPNYGTGFAPYFISLGLFVGALLISIVYPLKEASSTPTSGWSWFSSKWVTLFGVAVIQSIIVDAILLFGLRMEVQNVGLFVITTLLSSVTFMGLIQLLVTTLGDPGRFVAILILILQLVTSAGTYPLELIPEQLQWFNPLLPMTYSVSAFKSVISTASMDGLLHNSLILLMFTVITFIGTWVYFTFQTKKLQVKSAE